MADTVVIHIHLNLGRLGHLAPMIPHQEKAAVANRPSIALALFKFTFKLVA